MLKRLKKRIRGQSTAEYAVVIALVVAAVIAMQTYVKRGLQARMRDASIKLVEETNYLGNAIQYEPYYLESNFGVSREQSSITQLNQELNGVGGPRMDTSANVRREAGGYQKYTYSNQQ